MNQLELADLEQARGRGGITEVDIATTITEFKRRLTARGYAKSTIEGYGQRLDQFAGYLVDRKVSDVKEITRHVITDYREFVMSEAIAMETRALKIRAVKRLFEYLVETHQLLVNPTEGIVETCRKNRWLGPVLTVAEVEKLLQQPNLSLRTHIRDRAIMEVLYATAIRLGELLCLEVYHADFKAGVLYIRKGKGSRQRVVPLGKHAARYLREYLEKIRPFYTRKNPGERRIFLLNTGRPMTASGVRSLLLTYRRQAGIKASTSPHTLRRSCATHLLQNGADIRYIQKLLGHQRLSTTQLYTRIMPKDVKMTHDKTHPGVAGTGIRKEDPC